MRALPVLALLFAVGCGKDACQRDQERERRYYDDVYYDYIDSGIWYWDSGWFREPYEQPRNLEIGVGVREFIPVTSNDAIVPEYAGDGSRNVRVALRTLNMPRSGLEVALEAFVGNERVAANSYVGVRLQCIDRALVASNLRLDIDPSTLPPPPASSVREPIDRPLDDEFWWDSADTGLWREEVDRSDVWVRASLHDPASDEGITGEARWYVPR